MANNAPIFSRLGDIQGGELLITQGSITAGDYTGVGIYNVVAFTADSANGGFVQRLRFKPNGNNTAASVARIFINNGAINQATTLSTPSAPSGSASGTGGTLLPGSYYALIQAVDQYGAYTAASPQSTAVTTTGNTSSITWSWTPVASAAYYVLWAGTTSLGQQPFFQTAGNVAFLTQTVAYAAGNIGTPKGSNSDNFLYGELALPITSGTVSGTTPNADIDYPMNVALPPGYKVLVGLSANVSAGWYVTSIGGKY